MMRGVSQDGAYCTVFSLVSNTGLYVAVTFNVPYRQGQWLLLASILTLVR